MLFARLALLLRWTEGVLLEVLLRWTAGVLFARLLFRTAADLELTSLEADVFLTALLFRALAETLACDLLEAVRA